MNWEQLKVVELKEELKRRGLSYQGLKVDLIARLYKNDAERSQPDPPPSDDETQPEETQPDETQPDESAQPAASDPAPAPQELASEPDANPKAEVAASSVAADPELHAEESTAIEVDEPNEPEHAEDPGVSGSPETTEMNLLNGSKVSRNADETTAPDEQEPADMARVATPATDAQSKLPDTAAPSDNGTLEPTAEAQQETQKRKRRSVTPSLSPGQESRKRHKADMAGDQEHNGEGVAEKIAEQPIEDGGPDQDMVMDDVPPTLQPAPVAERVPSPAKQVPADREGSPESHVPFHADATETMEDVRAESETAEDIQYRAPIQQDVEMARQDARLVEEEVGVAPSLHPATTALYIKNFMRPLRPGDVKDHLAYLATPPNQHAPEEVVDFFLDPVRTHAFVTFTNVSAASRVRAALHDRVWPDEVNRKALWVDYVPAEKVKEWIELEVSSGGRRPSASPRWAVFYEADEEGTMVARLGTADGPASMPHGRPPTGPPGMRGPPLPPQSGPPTRPAPRMPRTASESANAIPLGPRAQRLRNAGPPARAGGFDTAPREPGGMARNEPGGMVSRTRCAPHISYQPVSEDLVRARLDDMHSYYTRDDWRDMGPSADINRYTFEDRYNFVDRGTEVFIGIRPPHRERAVKIQRSRPGFPAFSGPKSRDGRGRGYGAGGRGRGPGRRQFGGRGGDSYQPPRSRSRSPRRDGYRRRDNRSRYDDDDYPRDEDYRSERDYRDRERDRDDDRLSRY